MTNSLMVIHPYKDGDLWMFDDAATGLVREPFVAGADEIIDVCVDAFNIVGATGGFTLLFSAVPFPGHQAVLELEEPHVEPAGGATYRLVKSEVRGWLCPALFKYFDEPPEKIYLELRRKDFEERLQEIEDFSS